MRYYILAGVVAVLAAVWSGGWFFIADQLRAEIQRRAGQSNQARELTYRNLEITGYPFRMQVDMSDLRLALRGGKIPLRWEKDSIKAVGLPWKPQHVLFDLSGRHLFEAPLGARWHKMTMDSSEAMASIEATTSGDLERLSVDIKKLWLRYDGISALRGERLQLHSRPAPETANDLDLALRGDMLELIEGAMPFSLIGVPRTAKLVDLQSTITGLPRGGLSIGRLAQWRDGGGTLEIKTLHVQWGDMEISATGSLALDGQMRPIGALTAKIKGHDELLDAAVVTGMMDEDNVAAARAVLGILAAAGGGVLSVPVRLQDGQLFLGPAAVARLVPILGK